MTPCTESVLKRGPMDNDTQESGKRIMPMDLERAHGQTGANIPASGKRASTTERALTNGPMASSTKENGAWANSTVKEYTRGRMEKCLTGTTDLAKSTGTECATGRINANTVGAGGMVKGKEEELKRIRMAVSLTVAGGKRISQSWSLLYIQKSRALAKKQEKYVLIQSNERGITVAMQNTTTKRRRSLPCLLQASPCRCTQKCGRPHGRRDDKERCSAQFQVYNDSVEAGASDPCGSALKTRDNRS